MENDISKQKREQQRITRIARILTKKTLFSILIKKIILNLFVRFVLFVVKKWGVVGKTIRNFVVKSFGVKLCRLCVLCGNISLGLGV